MKGIVNAYSGWEIYLFYYLRREIGGKYKLFFKRFGEICGLSIYSGFLGRL